MVALTPFPEVEKWELNLSLNSVSTIPNYEALHRFLLSRRLSELNETISKEPGTLSITYILDIIAVLRFINITVKLEEGSQAWVLML